MSDDRGVYAGVLAAVERGEAMVMATVVRVRGSTPRDVGSKMLIGADGTQLGTIGGGCGEAEVLQA
ncbi:MAG TPA: XdhC family protein, partial [Solirubrobacterales bacterium]